MDLVAQIARLPKAHPDYMIYEVRIFTDWRSITKEVNVSALSRCANKQVFAMAFSCKDLPLQNQFLMSNAG